MINPPEGYKIERARRGFRFVHPSGEPSGIIYPSHEDAAKAAIIRNEIMKHHEKGECHNN